MSIWNVQPYLHAGYQYLHQVDVRWGWNGWNGWNTLDEINKGYTPVQLTRVGKAYIFILQRILCRKHGNCYLLAEQSELLKLNR
jgi:hypothetical protein